MLEYVLFLKEMIRSGVAGGAGHDFAMVMPPSAAGYDGLICAETNSLEYQQALGDVGSGAGGTCLTCSYTDLSSSSSRITARGRRVHGLYELTPLPPDVYSKVCRASLGGQVLFFSGLATAVLSDKRNLAVLSSPEHRSVFTASEQEVIDRHVPWTRLAIDSTVNFEGSEAPLREIVTARRDSFLLKRGQSTKRNDIFVGAYSTEEVWRAALQNAFAEGCWIVQERVVNPPLNYQSGTVGSGLHEMIYGCFAIGGRYAGTWLRIEISGKTGIINASRGAEESFLLEVDEP